MASQNTLEWNAEELICQKLLSIPAFADQDIRHWAKEDRAAIESIVVRAERGKIDMESPSSTEFMTQVSVSVLFASGKLTEAEADAIAGSIVTGIYFQDPLFNESIPDILPDITDCHITPDTNTVRTDTKKLRKRTITVPMLLKIAGEDYPINNMTKKGLVVIGSGVSTFIVTFSQSFLSVPEFGQFNIIPPSGEPQIGVYSYELFLDHAEVTLETETLNSGYKCNYLVS